MNTVKHICMWSVSLVEPKSRTEAVCEWRIPTEQQASSYLYNFLFFSSHTNKHTVKLSSQHMGIWERIILLQRAKYRYLMTWCHLLQHCRPGWSGFSSAGPRWSCWSRSGSRRTRTSRAWGRSRWGRGRHSRLTRGQSPHCTGLYPLGHLLWV